jgi:hypothetical protein
VLLASIDAAAALQRAAKPTQCCAGCLREQIFKEAFQEDMVCLPKIMSDTKVLLIRYIIVLMGCIKIKEINVNSIKAGEYSSN